MREGAPGFLYFFGVLLCVFVFIPCALARNEEISFATSGQRIRLSEGFGSMSGGSLNVSLSVVPLGEGIEAEGMWFYFVIFTESQYKNILYYNTYDPCILESFLVWIAYTLS